MSVDFEWQIDSELPPDEPRRRPRLTLSPRLARWLILLLAVLVLVVIAGLFWLRTRQRRLTEVESDVMAVARLELQALADGDLDLYISLQDAWQPEWFTAQKIRAQNGDAFPPPLPGLTAGGYFTVENARVVGDRARVEVVRTAHLRDGEVGRFRAVRFYRRAPDGRWLHTSVGTDYAGNTVSFVGENVEFVVYDRDREWIEPLVPDLEGLAGRLCGQVTCRASRPRRLSFTGLSAHVVDPAGVLPAPFLVGVPDDEPSREIWQRALQETVIGSLLTGHTWMQIRPSGELLYDRLRAWLWGRLGLADPVQPDVEFLRGKLARLEWLSLWSLLWGQAQDRELAEAETDLFLAFVEEEYGDEALADMLYSVVGSGGAGDAIWAALGETNIRELDSRFNEYVRRTLGMPEDLPFDVEPFAGYDLVAYCRTPTADLWGMSLDDEAADPLIARPTGFRLISWLPDGRYLLVMEAPIFGGEVYLVPSDGSSVRRVEAITSGQSVVGWSPDGRYLAYTTFEWPQGGGIVDVDTGEAVLLAGHPLDWSPDGAHLAYSVFSGIESSIWLADGDGSNPRRVSLGNSVGWSPDGGRLAIFSGEQGVKPQLLVYDLATEAITVIVDGPTLYETLSLDYGADASIFPPPITWSPDGEWIEVCLYQFKRGDVYEEGGGVFLVRPDGSDLHVLTDTSGRHTPVGWSPDGDYLGVLTYREQGGVVTTTVMSPAGEVKVEVSGYVTWSPDGAYLAVAGESRPPEVWDTTTWEVVTRFGMQCDTVVWNPAFTATGRAP